jgi:hypothetical protein
MSDNPSSNLTNPSLGKWLEIEAAVSSVSVLIRPMRFAHLPHFERLSRRSVCVLRGLIARNAGRAAGVANDGDGPGTRAIVAGKVV